MTEEQPKETVEEIKKSNKQNWAIMGIALLVIGIAFCIFVKDNYSAKPIQPSCDLNSTQQLIAYTMMQDTNQHQILLNEIQKEQQATAFLKTCTLLDQNITAGTQTIVCKVQGATQ